MRPEQQPERDRPHSPPKDVTLTQRSSEGDQDQAHVLGAPESVREIPLETFPESQLFEQSPEQWFRKMHPEWDDLMIKQAAEMVERATVMEILEQIRKDMEELKDWLAQEERQ